VGCTFCVGMGMHVSSWQGVSSRRARVHSPDMAWLLLACCTPDGNRDFQQGPEENDYDRQSRLARFNGAAAISSDAYFNREGSSGGAGSSSGRRSGTGQGGNPDDLTAAELVNRLSFHVRALEQQCSGTSSTHAGVALPGQQQSGCWGAPQGDPSCWELPQGPAVQCCCEAYPTPAGAP
jgi:hypothetical protein